MHSHPAPTAGMAPAVVWAAYVVTLAVPVGWVKIRCWAPAVTGARAEAARVAMKAAMPVVRMVVPAAVVVVARSAVAVVVVLTMTAAVAAAAVVPAATS